jgi:Sigma-70, region 4
MGMCLERSMNKRRQLMESKKVDASGNPDIGPNEVTLATDGATALAPEMPESEEEITREQRRSRRKRAVRARTISVKRMTKRELEIGRLLYPETDYWRPESREECVDGPRPCPFVSCKHHLFIDVSPRTGAIKLNFPDLEVWDMGESCALDVADRGGTTLEDVGAIMNLTRERIRQVEVKALAKLEALRDMMALREYVDTGPVGRRRLPRLTRADLEGMDADVEDKNKDDDDEDEETEIEAEPSEDANVDIEILDA